MVVKNNAVPLLHDYLAVSAARLPDKVALVCAGRCYTYKELDECSNALAHTLTSRGVRRGDRVVIFLDNTAETVISFWAILKANAIVSVISPLAKSSKLDYLINDCTAAALITDASLRDSWEKPSQLSCINSVIVTGSLSDSPSRNDQRVLSWDDAIRTADGRNAPQRLNLDIDLAAIIYTSGSTGDSKGVMLTHRNMLTAASSISSYLSLAEDDIILNALPMSFDYGLYQMIMAFRQGARLVLERSFAYPAQILKRIAEERVTGFPGVSTFFAILAEKKTLANCDLSTIRYVTNTAGALTSKHIQTLKALFPQAEIFSMFGLTECKRCTYLPPADLDRKPGSVGIAIPNTEIWIVDDQGQRVPPNTIGELVVRGATVMKGYWNKPGDTARVLKPGPLPGEQVLFTGDYCKLDEDGYLYFIGRKDDIFKSGGEKVAPKEIEFVLSDMPGVKEAAVVGVPDELLGRMIKAFVVLENGVSMSAQEVKRHCSLKLEPFFVPKEIQFVLELPRTDTGKVRKKELV